MHQAFEEGSETPSAFEDWREGVAHWVFMRKEVLGGLLFAIGISGVLFAFCKRFMTPGGGPAQFIPLFAVVVFILAFVRQRISLIVALLVMALQGFVYAPEIGYCMLGIGFVLSFVSVFGRFETLLVLAAPVIAGPVGAPLAIPLLTGFILGKQLGPVWTCFAYLSAFVCGLFLGLERFGLPGSQGVLDNLHMTAGTIASLGGFRDYFTKNLNFGDLVRVLQDVKDVYPVRFVSTLVLWLVVSGVVGAIYRKRRFVDQLAVEYLRKAKVATETREAKYRSMPMAIGVGTAIFVIGSIVIHFAVQEGEHRVPYHVETAAIPDIATGLLLMLLLAFRFHGDPRHTERMEAEARARRARRRQAERRESGVATVHKSTLLTPGSTAGFDQGKEARRKSRPRIPTRSRYGQAPPGRAQAELPPRVDISRPASADLGTSDWKPAGGEEDKEAISQAPFKLNEKIDGQYTIDKIRAGGMGVVYIVTDDFSGKRYAVKSLKDDLITNTEAMERFAVETKTWINLDHHPNIVQAMLYRVVNGRPLLFLEYIEGTDVERMLNMRQDYPVPQIVQWGIQICRGMAYAHNKEFSSGRVGLIHRDLKPANIMITRDGVLKITDFGLAKVVDTATGLTQQSTGLGTLSYMPPEQLEDASSVDKRADIYSFGALLYETITGRPPFTADSVAALAMSVMSQAPAPPSSVRADCPKELDRVILKCLEKSRDHRYSTFEEIEQDLTVIASTMPQAEAIPGAGRPGITPTPTPPSGTPTPTPAARGVGEGTSLIEAIMFIDMVASTAKGSKYGDNLVMQLKNELAQIVETESVRHRRVYLKGTGDGYMITFPDPEKAVRAASEIMQKLNERNQALPGYRRIDTRMGIHFGEVRLDSRFDRQGSAVNMAERIENVTPTQFHQTRMGVSLEELREENRIFISEVVNEEIANCRPGFRTRLVGYFDLKGFPGRHRVYEVHWK
jgi:class 3 adenylate cyclase/tRNA A-37 threonylcarbamoyl transferase component Bud32